MELQLSLYLSLSSLKDDKEISRFMDGRSATVPITTTTAMEPTGEETIQHQNLSTTDTDTNADIIPSDTDLNPVDDTILSSPIPNSPDEPAPAPAPPVQPNDTPRDSHALSTSTDALSSSTSLADEWTFLYTHTNTDTHPHTQHPTNANINTYTSADTLSDNQTPLHPQTPLPLSPFSETETWILVE
jgi:hypothetical protein